MILDRGIVSLRRTDGTAYNGNMFGGEPAEYHCAMYGERTVGMNRYYAAQQANTKIDRLIRILAYDDVRADDIAYLADGYRYRVVQSQAVFDSEAGCDVTDISLERIGYRDGNDL